MIVVNGLPEASAPVLVNEKRIGEELTAKIRVGINDDEPWEILSALEVNLIVVGSAWTV